MAQTIYQLGYSDSFPRLLAEWGGTLAISTYQAGKLIMLSSLDGRRIRQYAKHFPRPMGIAFDGHRLAVANKLKVTVFANSPGLADSYPKRPGYYDGMFMPRAVYYSGYTDLHDIAWGKEQLWGVNTLFSCLATIDDKYSFQPKWKPNFVSALTPDDRCHLNGLAMACGQPGYVTALGCTDKKEAWRSGILEGGVLIDCDSHNVLLDQLPMPHSPRYDDNTKKLYFLLSASGEIWEYDVNTNETNCLAKVGKFIRGMELLGNHLIIGLSKIRESGSFFKKLPIASQSKYAGILVIDKNNGETIAEACFLEGVDETFDIKFLPCYQRCIIADPESSVHKNAIAAPPDLNFWKKRDK
jgi:uncharacterized protein (TIGR03032 family)